MLFTRNRCQLRFRWNTSSYLQYCHFVKIQKSFERLLRGGNGRRVFSCKDHQAKQRDGGWIPKKHEGFFVKLSVLHPCSTNLKEVSTDLYGWSVVEEHLKRQNTIKNAAEKSLDCPSRIWRSLFARNVVFWLSNEGSGVVMNCYVHQASPSVCQIGLPFLIFLENTTKEVNLA
jgi:hypothetical protein